MGLNDMDLNKTRIKVPEIKMAGKRFSKKLNWSMYLSDTYKSKLK